ncbi:MAG: amino acid permease, partial [Ruminococcaceae bacterium]|nr:amino acid permease [Oscillospiraceae bacterium]
REMGSMGENNRSATGLRPAFSPLGIWAFSIGTSIGWGSFIVTCNTYLQKSGLLGTVFGLLIGMAVILVITWNLQYMIRQSPGAGGIYTFEKKVSGSDFGFLAAWFVLLTYMAILWANITSVPLFARFFLGNTFRFGFHYSIFGYEVWMGEALLSICAVVLIGLLCARSLRIPHAVTVAGSVIFALGFTVCAVLAALRHNGALSYEPFYTAGSAPFAQIVRIAAISPWAFIGFENIAHFSEEYRFPVKKVKGILICSVIITTLLYLLLSLLSVSAYPPEYASWLDYVEDMGNLDGIRAVPAFFAADYYLGKAGVAVLMLSLFGVILTSLFGNMLALSRLLFAAGRDREAPESLGRLNAHGIPSNAIRLIVIVSVFIPFLGRTAIGWIVDVTTLGATIIYGLLSHAVFRHAKLAGNTAEKVTGMLGFLLMLVFLLLLLIPGLLPFDAMATESYFLFIVWAVVGLGYFRHLVRRDSRRQYGSSIVVWVILLLLVLFASMMWVSRETESATQNAMSEIYAYHQTHPTVTRPDADADTLVFLHKQAERIQRTNALFTIVSFGLFFLSTAIMLNNYRDTRLLGQQLSAAERSATTDQLTGVKNRLSYAQFEEALNDRIESGGVSAFAVVVCDVNGLKHVNDNQGHSAGDTCIRNACALICKVFKRSPVFRIGGDEFAVLLEGDDYDNRATLLEQIAAQAHQNMTTAGATLSAGMSEYIPGQDDCVHPVFTRADRQMYRNKNAFKAEKARLS